VVRVVASTRVFRFRGFTVASFTEAVKEALKDSLAILLSLNRNFVRVVSVKAAAPSTISSSRVRILQDGHGVEVEVQFEYPNADAQQAGEQQVDSLSPDTINAGFKSALLVKGLTPPPALDEVRKPASATAAPTPTPTTSNPTSTSKKNAAVIIVPVVVGVLSLVAFAAFVYKKRTVVNNQHSETHEDETAVKANTRISVHAQLDGSVSHV